MFTYLTELKFFTKYYFLSFFLSFLVCFQKFSSLLIFFYYPISKIIKKKLLILNTLDLLNISWLLSANTSFLISLTTLNLVAKLFFASSWYSNQTFFFNNFFCSILNNLIFLFISFFLFFKIIFDISLFWNFGILNSFNLFEIQLQVFQFVKFQNLNLNISWTIFVLTSSIFLITKSFLTWKNLFIVIKIHKNSFFFFLFLSFSFFFSDLNSFFFFLFLSFSFLEFIFFFICFRLNNFLKSLHTR